MQTSIIIPVWNGAELIGPCLDAVYKHSGPDLLEVICVDNASSDESARLISDGYPQVKLICQPVNLGFSGGVNAGIDAARGELFVLVNQDCLPQSGWLEALLQGLRERPAFGIAGCTILNPDGSINHAGAYVRHPGAYGTHVTSVDSGESRASDYVTGTVFAVRRTCWRITGGFDEGFYPAYYEEIDYCYRARRRGSQVGYIPSARVVHLSASREWQTQPISHWANQHRMRYRFVAKHFDVDQTNAFFAAELEAASAEMYFEQAFGRTLAARDTLHDLQGISLRRREDLGESIPAIQCRQFQVGFTGVLRDSLRAARKLATHSPPETPRVGAQVSRQWEPRTPPETPDNGELASRQYRLETLRQREYDLMRHAFYRSSPDARQASLLKRLFRQVAIRGVNAMSGCDFTVLPELDAVRAARMDLIAEVNSRQQALLGEQLQQHDEQMQRHDEHLRLDDEQLRLHAEQLRLLEMLVEYDYR